MSARRLKGPHHFYSKSAPLTGQNCAEMLLWGRCRVKLAIYQISFLSSNMDFDVTGSVLTCGDRVNLADLVIMNEIVGNKQLYQHN